MNDPLDSINVDACTQEILLLAARHDLAGLKPLLRVPGAANVQDPETGQTPLHAAIGALAGDESNNIDDDNDDDDDGNGELAAEIDRAKATVRELFLSGGIWNDLDRAGETPGCLAWRLAEDEAEKKTKADRATMTTTTTTVGGGQRAAGLRQLYELVVEAGVRAEMLLGLLGDGGYEELGSEGEDEEMDEEEENEGEEVMKKDEGKGAEEDAEGTVGEKVAAETANGNHHAADAAESPDAAAAPLLAATTTAAAAAASTRATTSTATAEMDSATYLSTPLDFTATAILDAAANGVMMAWEAEIMRRSAAALNPAARRGLRVLNVGFGMGIVDALFAAMQPAAHHIVEAHPSVLAAMAAPGSAFGAAWRTGAARGEGPETRRGGHDDDVDDGGSGGPRPRENVVHAGRWQDVCGGLLAANEVFDIIYFDTFAEEYRAGLREFFSEYVVGLLEPEGGRFGFFNGMGADRRVCYDVCCRVAELDLCEAGLDVEWEDVAVGEEIAGSDREGRGEWEGVRRRYWTLDKYRMPTCSFMG